FAEQNTSLFAKQKTSYSKGIHHAPQARITRNLSPTNCDFVGDDAHIVPPYPHDASIGDAVVAVHADSLSSCYLRDKKNMASSGGRRLCLRSARKTVKRKLGRTASVNTLYPHSAR
ncbi:MAG: hypothetical protein IKW76_07425, partial [Clostridia bacterium]|nr:hypothetical protein [Clostridia bacterium]